jgi:hypothetical protein
MIARRYPVVFVPTNKSPAQGGLAFHSAQFLPLSWGRPRGATTLIAICLSYPGTHRLVAELKLPGCSCCVRPARTSFTVCRRNAGANCGRVLGIVAPFQAATCPLNWASRQQTVHRASIEDDPSRAIHSPRLVTLIAVSVHPSTPQKICTTSRGSTSSRGGCPRQKNLSSIFGFLRLRNAYAPINPPPIRRSPIETRISQRGVKPRGGRTTFRT